MNIVTQDVWTTGSYSSLAIDITSGPAVDPPESWSWPWIQAAPALRSALDVSACVALTALFMVCLPLIAVALLLLRFVIVGVGAAVLLVVSILYVTHAPFRTWLRTRVSNLTVDPA